MKRAGVGAVLQQSTHESPTPTLEALADVIGLGEELEEALLSQVPYAV